MNGQQVQWTSPTPLWTGLAGATTARAAFPQPAILRFAADSFMEDFLQVLERDPAQLTDLLARPEDWRGPAPAAGAPALLEPRQPMSGLARKLERLQQATTRLRALTAPEAAHNVTLVNNQAAEQSLRLYQPAHQRYYLVTACLVCGLPGLPDRTLDAGRQERAFFVLRRLLPPNHTNTSTLGRPDANWQEYAFVNAPGGGGWQLIDEPKKRLIDGEEPLPLFPLNYAEDDGRRRRLLAGVIPVGKREALLGANKYAPNAAPPSTTGTGVEKSDPRMIRLYNEVTEPWKRVIERAWEAIKLLNTPSNPAPSTNEKNDFLKVTREQIQTSSWYILLDLHRFLTDYGLTNNLDAILRHIVYAPPGGAPISLKDALAQIANDEALLEAAATSYVEGRAGWPALRFTLADAASRTALIPDRTLSNGVKPLNDAAAVAQALVKIEELAEQIRGLLPRAAPAAAPPLVAQKPLDARGGWFVIRCVFDRPNCGPLEPAIVSAPTVAFQMASFFDPDAPARPIRIALPMDTSPAGLRKFDKNTAFMISDVLCGQIKRVQGLTLGDLVRSVLPWPFHKDLSAGDDAPCPGGPDAGMMCSLSIPIITICALLLLMIIVSLLDIIFRWIPYFILCFPLPGFKAKGS